jgi:hypothetical protein
VQAAEAVASNLDLMTRLTAEVAGDLHGRFGAPAGDRPLVITPFASTEEYVFVTNVFTSELTRAGVRTLLPGAAPRTAGNAAPDSLAPGTGPSAAPAAGALVLTVQNVAFGLSYPDVYRSHVVGGKKVRREATVRVLATLSDPSTGEVLWTGEAERSHADQFDRDDAARVETGTYAFLRPEMPSSGWTRYAEPVFVTAIIVGLIYLFFSNQSDN